VRPSAVRGRHAHGADPALPLRLPVPPALPGRLLPEFSVPCAGPFDDPDFRFSIDWDGARTLLFASPEGVHLQSESLTDVSDRYPEIVAAAAALTPRSVVLDGVVAVLDPSGCPDLAALGERMALGAGAQGRLPAVYLVIDILHLDGRETMGLALDPRLDAVRTLELPDPRIQVPDWVAGQGEALAEAAGPRRLPALLARRGSAPYRPGVASPDRLRIELRGRANCVVVGAERLLRSTRRRRLQLAEHVGSRLVEAGRAEIAETSTLWRWAAPGGRMRSPLIATVDHRGRAADGSLRQPEVVTLRDDIDPNWCIRRHPVPPPAGGPVAAGGFRPTVLTALPLEM
jgi:bifunctional non-homologous end joining protein LigD